MKRCFKCDGMFPLSEFYRHPQMGDGHLNKCKTCTKRDTAEREARLRSTPEGLAAERARHRDKHHRLGYTERYRGRYAGKYQREHEARYPERAKARQMVSNAVRDGKMVRPAQCQDCGAGGVIHGHHPDYSKPLEVEWLCVRCHGVRHRKSA